MRNVFFEISLCNGDSNEIIKRRYYVDKALDYNGGVKEFHLLQMEELFDDAEAVEGWLDPLQQLLRGQRR